MRTYRSNCGIVSGTAASSAVDPPQFLDREATELYLLGQPYTAREFATPGPYRLVRHPLYVGWFFAFWMTPTMTLAHLVFSMMTSAYILVAIQLEEHDLAREFGATYDQYRRRVPMLVPFSRSHHNADAAAGVKTASAAR